MKRQNSYSIKWLIDFMASGQSPEFIFFWGHRAKQNNVTKACFSQWWPSNFTVGRHSFATAEHWMMAQKAKLFGEQAMIAKILETPDPGRAKGLGRKVKNFDPKLWDSKKFEIVVEGNLHKFQQNSDLKDFLLATDGKILVEASPVDPIWGIGLAQDHEDVANPEKWRGPNLLGFALMVVRDTLKGAKR